VAEPVREPDPFEVFASDEDPERALLPEPEPTIPARPARPAMTPAPRAITQEPAPVGRRLWAAIIDGAILLGIDVVVLYLTLQLTGLPAREMLRLPLLPLLGFLALLNGGYLVSFTVAQGQTIGKGLAGIRVVSASGNRVPLASAVVRAAAVTVSVLPLGIGCLPVLASGDRLALHDRLSGTRVVRA
jgi:uncharacterized RDD family membrane protein YckC